MEGQICFRCSGPRVIPGGFAEPPQTFTVDPGIAKRASLFRTTHLVELEEIAWLCLDCGLAWQQTKSDSFESMKELLREKCLPQFRADLFGDSEQSEN